MSPITLLVFFLLLFLQLDLRPSGKLIMQVKLYGKISSAGMSKLISIWSINDHLSGRAFRSISVNDAEPSLAPSRVNPSSFPH